VETEWNLHAKKVISIYLSLFG